MGFLGVAVKADGKGQRKREAHIERQRIRIAKFAGKENATPPTSRRSDKITSHREDFRKKM